MYATQRTPFRSLSRRQVLDLANRYSYASDAFITNEIRPSLERRGHLTGEEFQAICKWKTPRSKSRVAQNEGALIEEASRIVFSAREERLRIGTFTLLKGVSYPTSSVFLHFLHQDMYPLLDVRTLESLGMDKPAVYTFEFWWEYVLDCRQLAKNLDVDMRTLDKALWQYSKSGPS
jgi:hypothetical protein